MDPVPLILLALVGLAMVPTLYVAGMQDVANSIAIPVRTRALTASVATWVSAIFHGIGVLIALPLGIWLFSWFEFPDMDPELSLGMILAALLSVGAWGAFAYFKGMPVSITHGLIASVLGGSLAILALEGLDAEAVLGLPWFAPLMTLLISPLVAFGLAYALVFATVPFARGEDPDEVNRVARTVQSISVGITGLGTGLQQGQRFSFLLLIALISAGVEDPTDWMPYAYIVFALVISAGCLTGGWRIGHVLGHRLVAIDPLRGMIAATATSGLLFIGSIGLALPLSTSLVAASSIMGAGSNQRFATVNWRQFIRMCLYWGATPVAAGGATAVLTLAMSPLLL